MSVPVARRQLLARKGRTFAGIAGIATALLLVLALKAIFAGMEQRLTAYIDESGAEVIVAQSGVQSMHMTESALPEQAAQAIAAVPGVARARPILYVPATLERGDKRALVYLVGEGRGETQIALARGRRPGRGEIVLDHELAASLGSPPGSSVRAFGRSFRVSGEVSGFTLISNAFAFVRLQDLAATLRSSGVVSYILVDGEPGVRPSELAERIERAVPAVTASTREAFAQSERRLVGDMSTDIVRAMILVGFVIGVAVAGLVAYSSALSQLRDYAVLRALGLRARASLGLALSQVGAMVAAAFLLALALVWVLAQLLPAVSPLLSLAIKPGDVAQALAVAGAVALGAAALPAFRVSRVDPASVFRR
jgi:putative ABC transport system permease protein